MKIIKLEVTEPAHMRDIHMSRCEYQVRRYITQNRRYQCCRYAHYDINDLKVCKQHAGTLALLHLLENNNDG